MDIDDKTEGRQAEPEDRRSSPRFEVAAEAEVFFVGHGLILPARVVDLSLRGCRLDVSGKFPLGIRVLVEVTFSVNRIPFRLLGKLRRSRGQRVGVEFIEIPAHRLADWTQLVEEVESAKKLEAKAPEEAAAAQVEDGEARNPEAKDQEVKDQEAEDQEDSPANGQIETVTSQPKPEDDRRVTPRFHCNGVAEVRVLPLGGKRSGVLLDLSAGGCCIEMRDPFPVTKDPIYVEVTFSMGGFQLRVGGVVRYVNEDRRAGIEFTDVTERKAAQIEELVAELIEMDKHPRPPTCR